MFIATMGSKKVIFSKRGEVYVSDIPAGKAMLKDRVVMDNMVANVDYMQEWAQLFDEVWRAFRDGFYVENMHGLDWKAIKKK